MPNWCSNKLAVRGRRDDVSEFLKFLSAVKGEQGLFNSIIPMPTELRNTRSPETIVSDEEYQEWVDGKHPTHGCGMPITHRMSLDYRTRFGANNWYDWAYANWDTKWDVFEKDISKTEWATGTGVTLEFDTAWAPPCAVIQKLSEKFPKLRFSISYVEEGMGVKGCEHYGPHD